MKKTKKKAYLTVRGYVNPLWKRTGYRTALDGALANGDLLSDEAGLWKSRDFDVEEEKRKLVERLQGIMQRVLTKRERKLIAYRVHGLSFVEIAEEFKTDVSTVKSSMETARKKIKKALEK